MNDTLTLATDKLVVVLKKGLEVGPALNAVAHMAACLGAQADTDTRARMSFLEYRDKGGGVHPVSGLSLVVLAAKNSNQIRTARAAALEARVLTVDFTQSMTGDTSVEQMQRTSEIPETELDYWGLAMFGASQVLNPITKKFSLWR